MSRKKKSTVGKKKTRTKRKSPDVPQPQVRALFDRVVAIMDGARERVVRRVNHEMLIAYWHIGREIVEQVQEGEGRAAYGRQVLKALSKRLTERYGRGFSFTNLSYFRLFYKAYETRLPEVEAVSGGGSVDPGRAHPAVAPDDRVDDSGRSRHKSSDEKGIGGDAPIHHTVCDELGTSDLSSGRQAAAPRISGDGSGSDRRKSSDGLGMEGTKSIHHAPSDELETDSSGSIGHPPCDQLGAGDPGVDQRADGPESRAEDVSANRCKHGVGKRIEDGRIHHEPSDEFGSRGPRPIGHEASDQLESSDALSQILPESDGLLVDLECAVSPDEPFVGFAPRLSWSHYRTLTKVASRAERQFYEIEANAQGWSVRQLERQIDSLLFARLLKSRDKAGVLELSTKGQVIESPVDALKDPYVLDFLDLPDSDALHESNLEAAILHKLRSFLLELGKGFAFVARQQRLTHHRR